MIRVKHVIKTRMAGAMDSTVIKRMMRNVFDTLPGPPEPKSIPGRIVVVGLAACAIENTPRVRIGTRKANFRIIGPTPLRFLSAYFSYVFEKQSSTIFLDLLVTNLVIDL